MALSISEILRNSRNTGGKELDGILSLDLGMNLTQLRVVISMGPMVLASAKRNAGDGNVLSSTGKMFR